MPAAKRPNILSICTDQQRYDALGCYGNAFIETPTIDGLADHGVLFEQCYVQNPVCAPSRASLVTGQYPHLHGLWANGVALSEHAELFSRKLADSGYSCGMIGKMHLEACFNGRTEKRRDDGYTTYNWAHDPTHTSPENDYHRWMKERFPDIFESAFEHDTRERHEPIAFDTIPTEAHYSRWASERAIQFLDQDREDDNPFSLWVNFFDPHHPFVAPREYLERYDLDEVPDPVASEGELDTKSPIQTEASRHSYAGHARGFTSFGTQEIKEVIAAYYAMVTLIDDEVKRILNRLEALGLEDETIVFFTSHHGEMLGDHQQLLKGPCYMTARFGCR